MGVQAPREQTRPFITRLLLILAVACACGALWNAIRPRGAIAWVEDWRLHVEARARREGFPVVTLVEAQEIVAARARIVLDARRLVDYYEGHLPGALPLPFEPTPEDIEAVRPFLTPEPPIMTYCSGQDCDDSLLLAKWLRDQGYTDVVIFAAGYEKWVEAGQAIERGGML